MLRRGNRLKTVAWPTHLSRVSASTNRIVWRKSAKKRPERFRPGP